MGYQDLSSAPLAREKTSILKMALRQTGVSLERLTCEDICSDVKRYIRRAYPVFYEKHYGGRDEELCTDYVLLFARRKR